MTTEESRYWSHSCREKGNYRWWLNRRRPTHRDVMHIEVSWRSHLTGLWFGRGEEGGHHASIGLYWLYASIGWKTPWAKFKGRRNLSLTFHGGSMYWCLWRDDFSWSRDVPRWRDGSFSFVDALLGRWKCETKIVETRDVLVPMPEGTYQATAELTDFIYTRPRWFTKTVRRVDIKVPKGIPFEGKGENSWDCGSDATYGMCTGPCSSIPEAVGKLVGSVLKDRVKNGGWSDWSWQRETA